MGATRSRLWSWSSQAWKKCNIERLTRMGLRSIVFLFCFALECLFTRGWVLGTTLRKVIYVYNILFFSALTLSRRRGPLSGYSISAWTTDPSTTADLEERSRYQPTHNLHLDWMGLPSWKKRAHSLIHWTRLLKGKELFLRGADTSCVWDMKTESWKDLFQ